MVAPTIYEQAPTPMYMGGPGAPPPLPMALPGSYGTPMPIPPQAVTSTVPYDYGQQVNTVAQYNPVPMAAPFGPPGAVLGGGNRGTSLDPFVWTLFLQQGESMCPS